MKCQSCGHELPRGAKFCPECGERQTAEEAILSPDEIAQIEASSQTDEYTAQLKKVIEQGLAIERRDVAVLFADISGYSAVFSALSSEQVRDVMRDVYSVMAGAITRCGGYVSKFIGDEVMAVFGAPIASERPCERAIIAVDEIEIGLTGVNFRFKEILPMQLSIHAGIACGPVEAGKVGESQKLEYEFLGQTVNIAKRLTDAAFAKTVFVSSQVKRLTEESFDFDTLGSQQLPGISKPMEVFRLAGPKGVMGERIGFSELGASMFGRDEEFDALKAAFKRLRNCYPDPRPCEAGEGEYHDISHIFGITGEAGIGKSRLKRELRRHMRDLVGRRGARFLVGGSWGIGKTPLYWPIKEQIASALGFEPSSNSEEIAEGLSSLADAERFDQEHVPYIHHLFGFKFPRDPLALLDPKSIEDNLWIAIRKLYECWALQKPLVLVFEDMHWSDGGTSEFVEYLGGFATDFPVIVFLLYRPGYEPKFARIERIPFTEMKLGPLSNRAETELLSFYLADGARERALVRRVRKYSEGNPLFAEEFLHLLLERGKLRQEDGRMHLTRPIEKMPLPTGLSGVLGERFDRLSRRDKQVAYYGAVIGRSFLYQLLLDLHGRLHRSSHIEDCIQSLIRREIIFETAIEPDLEYIFKHALTREMLVSRLVDSLRRELSGLIAKRIEELYKDRLEEFHGTLSEHYEIAGDVEQAARHAALCAIREQKLQHNFEALSAFEKYDRICEGLLGSPLSVQEQKDLILSRADVLQELGRWDSAIDLCKLLASLADGEWRGAALCEEARLRELRGDWQQSLSLAQKALESARETGDKRIEATSLRRIGIVHDQRGQWDLAIRCFEQSFKIHRELDDRPGIAASLVDIGIVHSNLGEYDQAILRFQEASNIYRELDDRRNIALALQATGAVCYQRGRLDQALEHFDEAMLTCRELGSRRGLAGLLLNISLAHSDRGEFDMALQSLDESLTIFRELGDQTGIGSALNNTASVCADMGQWVKARKAALQAEAINRAIGSKAFLSDSLAVLCRAEAAAGSWVTALSSGDEAKVIADEVRNLEQMVISRLSLSEAHHLMQRWHAEAQQGHRPPVCLDEAIKKATDYAEEAKGLAESNGMQGYVRRANRLLAQINGSLT